MNYNWGAFVLWVRESEKLITGLDIQSGDSIVALQEKGFRSNGLSLVRNIMSSKYGPDWHLEAGEVFTSRILHPSTIYSSAIMKMIGGYGEKGTVDIHGIVHVTGGGVPGKLSRLLKRTKKGASLHDLFDAPPAMRSIQEMGNVTDEEAYRTWNMGQGILIITDEPEKIVSKAASFGIAAKVSGIVTDEDTIIIRSRGVEYPGSDIIFTY
jgi:phosphoribosylformylglycinamidine cyclo-ligase